MTEAIKQFTLDIDQQTVLECVHVREGDTARGICISLMGSGIPYEIEDGCTATILAALPDDTHITGSGTIDGNRVSFTIPATMTAQVGIVRCNLMIEDGTAALCSPAFIIVVDEINAA